MEAKDTLETPPAAPIGSKPAPVETKPRFSKTDARYWASRVFKRRSETNYTVQIGFAGKQERWPLETPNRDAAAAKAKEIFLSLKSAGLEATRTTFKPWTNTVQKITSPTVGEYLAAAEAHGGINPVTFTSYARKFRRLVAGVAGLKGDASRFHHGEGSNHWRAAVDGVHLQDLTAGEINRWRADYVAAKRGDALKQHRAQTTAISILRNAKCLFAVKVRRRIADAQIELQMPSPLPFEDVEIGKPPSHRFTSTTDVEKLARAANKELPAEDIQLFKIFLLAFGVGLRRGEIDRLTWAAFNWTKAQINVVITAHGDAKTESSIAAVDVDPALMKLFRKFKRKAVGEFVIESTVRPLPGATWHHYRCDCAFKRLNAWLRAKGVDTPNPIHTLRKEFGTLICQKFGIFAASEALRHADIRLTRAHYVDRRGRIHLEMGKMLEGSK